MLNSLSSQLAQMELTLEEIILYTSFVSDITGIAASIIAIYLFIFKRKSISAVFSLLLNYAYQLSLSEIKENLEKLNEFNANDSEQCNTVINILHDISGQIRGNSKLESHFSTLLERIDDLSDKRRLTEPRKRALVSELRERIRHLNLENIDNLLGSEK